MGKKTLNSINWQALSSKKCCIHLENQDYTGTIPTEIGLLTELTSGLFLNGNSLTGNKSRHRHKNRVLSHSG